MAAKIRAASASCRAKCIFAKSLHTTMLIGRSKELQVILKEIRKPATAGDVKRIIAINGMFGVGKSTLLRELIAEIQNGDEVDAILYSNEDAHIKYLPEFVYQLINSFRACRPDVPRYKSDETDSRWMRFSEIQRELEDRREVNGNSPEVGGEVHQDEVARHLAHRNADDRRLMTDTAAVMCETLLVDLMNTFFPLRSDGNEQSKIVPGPQPRKILIVIDTYEKMTLALNMWLLEYFLLYCYIKRFGDFRSYNSPFLSTECFVRQFFDIRFVIAGREALRSTDKERRWDRWQQTLLEITLQQFNAENIRDFITEERIDGVVNVDEVLNQTAGLPYLVTLWSHSFRRTTQQGDDQTIAAHAQERIYWYKTPEQIEWIRCAAFCDWFDADLLRCFPIMHTTAHEAFAYLRKSTELSRESINNASKLELLPIIRDSIRKAVQQESPDVAQEYSKIVQTFLDAKKVLAPFKSEEQAALRHVAYCHRFDSNIVVKQMWPSDLTIVDKLNATAPHLFEKHRVTQSLKADLRALLDRYNSYDERNAYATTQQLINDVWKGRTAELQQEHTQLSQLLRKTEEQIIRSTAEQENAELQLRDAQSQVMELESQLTPLRKSTPALTLNRDAVAARLALIFGIPIAAGAWYTHEIMANFQAAPEVVDSVQKVLFAFSVGFILLFAFFVSRSFALRARRREQQRNRTRLHQLESEYSDARESLNECFTTLEARKKEAALAESEKVRLVERQAYVEACLAEPYV